MIPGYKFYFNGKNSADYGIFLKGESTYGAPAKSIEKVSVPGRNGDLIISNGNYENQSYVLKSGIVGVDNLHEKLRDFRSFMLSTDGYCRLEDDYHPDEYRLAHFAGPIDFDVTLLMVAECDLTFDCKPQHFLKDGETDLDFVKPNTDLDIFNPTYFPSNPLITITGYGTLQIGNGQITVAKNSYGTINCDCESLNSYSNNSDNANSCVTVRRGTLEHMYPQIEPGDNIIRFDSTITKVTVKPRWWML